MKIVITGGASIINNIGDQAMLYTLIEYIKKTYPDSDIVLFDEDLFQNEELRLNYKIRVLPDIPMNAKLKIVNKFLYILYRLTGKKNRFSSHLEAKIVNEYKTCDIIFQLAGFTMSSQMGINNTLARLFDIVLAKKLHKKIILLPQSIGPFNYKIPTKIIFGFYLRKYINYPEKVLCREKFGKELLEKYGCTKAEIEHDIVLSRPNNIEPSFIYNKAPKKQNNYYIDNERDIVVVPNYRLLKYRSEDEITKIFENIITKSLKLTSGKAFIFNHVHNDDDSICKAIYSRFTEVPSVILIDSGYDCIQTEEFFQKFSMAIVCRWHSNVHVIRAGIPYVVIGWAEKYHETSRIFNNEELIFDIRNPIIEKDITTAIYRVYNNRKEAARKIVEIESEIKQTFCLDRIMKDITEGLC